MACRVDLLFAVFSAGKVSPEPLGDEGRRVLDELARIKLVDVVVPTRNGTQIRRRCVTRPDEHQAILLQRLGLHLPSSLPVTDNKLGRM